jgi:hypothetical protein
VRGEFFKDFPTTGDEKAEAKKVERALFFVKGERCFLLHEVGATIEADLEGCCGRDSEAGPWPELPKQDGLWIWEGTPGWSDGRNWEGIDEGGDPIYEGRGKARRPAENEMHIIINGPIEKLWGPPALDIAIMEDCELKAQHSPERGPCPDCPYVPPEKT